MDLAMFQGWRLSMGATIWTSPHLRNLATKLPKVELMFHSRHGITFQGKWPELPSLPAALPPAPPLVNVPNTSSIFPSSHKHPYIYYSIELKKYFPTLYESSKISVSNMTKRIWEKTFLVNFTHRYGCKAPKQNISKSNSAIYVVKDYISWQNWAFFQEFKVVLLFGHQLIYKINSSKEKNL